MPHTFFCTTISLFIYFQYLVFSQLIGSIVFKRGRGRRLLFFPAGLSWRYSFSRVYLPRTESVIGGSRYSAQPTRSTILPRDISSVRCSLDVSGRRTIHVDQRPHPHRKRVAEGKSLLTLLHISTHAAWRANLTAAALNACPFSG